MRRVCASCNVINRVPVRHLAEVGKGRCGTELPPHSAPIVTPRGPADDIVNSARAGAGRFLGAVVRPCRAVAAEVKKAAHNLSGKALVLKVDTDELGDLAQRYQVSSIPNFALFSGGRLVRQRSGATDHRQLETFAIAPQ
jgi:thioredoxin 2